MVAPLLVSSLLGPALAQGEGGRLFFGFGIGYTAGFGLYWRSGHVEIATGIADLPSLGVGFVNPILGTESAYVYWGAGVGVVLGQGRPGLLGSVHLGAYHSGGIPLGALQAVLESSTPLEAFLLWLFLSPLLVLEIGGFLDVGLVGLLLSGIPYDVPPYQIGLNYRFGLKIPILSGG